MMLEIAAMIAAVAFAILCAVLVSTLLKIQKTATQTEQLLQRINVQITPVLSGIMSLTTRLSALADHARATVDQVTPLLDAAGELGRTVQQAQGFLQNKSTQTLVNVASVTAGLKAAWDVVKGRFSHHHNGGNGGGYSYGR